MRKFKNGSIEIWTKFIANVESMGAAVKKSEIKWYV